MARGTLWVMDARQRAIYRDWTKRSVKNRCSVRLLAKDLGVSASTLSDRLRANRDPTTNINKHVPTAELEQRYALKRDQNAELFTHERVTAAEVTDDIQLDYNGTKFKSKSRVQKAVRNKAHLRDPVRSPTFGERAKLSQLKADLKHHCR